MEYDTRFAILGPLRVWVGDRELAVRAVRERTLLAMLVVHANNLVPTEQLVDAIWGDRPPREARNQVQGCVSRLRRRLASAGAGEVIRTGPEGYQVRVLPGGADVLEFRRLVGEARAAAASGRPEEARYRYRAGLKLWRGPVLAGIDSDVVRQAATRLDEERVQAWEECFEVELALGAGGELVPELTDLVRHHPYRESLHGALMRALYRAGRHADALAAYRRVREVLRDELGMDPSAELQRLHRLVLSRDPELDWPGGAPRPPAAGTGPAPRELPAEASCFVGRERELARVCRVLRPAGREARRRPAVMVLYGPGGMGKSALAVRAGHHFADEFRDGQLYVDLFGSTPGMRPLPAVEVLGRLLRSLRVHPAEVPSTEVEAVSLFRSLTAERRLLLVLDNAADRDQVASLVPSAPGCAVLVTSRQPLPTLDADDRLRLDRLSDRDALALLAGLAAGRALAVEAARRIVAHSGGLPLAVRVAAGRLASRPDLPAHEYASRLSDASRRLDELQLDDLAVRACIRTGYDAVRGGGDPMGELAARAFRALGLLQVPDVAPGVVAAMLAVPELDTARTALDRLVDAQLLEPVHGGRYRLHDLVRLVATELATDEDSPADRERAFQRALAFYITALWRLEPVTYPGRVLPYPRPPILEGEFVPSFQEKAPASAWIDQELPSLVAAFEQAATSIAGGSARSLLWYGHTLWLHLDARCDWLTAYQVSRLVLGHAERHGDQELIAWGLLLHGRSEACLGRLEAGAAALEESLALLRETGNEIGIAIALNGLGLVHTERGLLSESLSCHAQALDAARENSDYLMATILSNMCVTYAMLGQLEQAECAGSQSLAIVPGGKGYPSAMVNLATVYGMRGDHAEAIRLLDQGLAMHEEAGDRMRACEALIARSEINRLRGDSASAAADTERALAEAQVWGYRYLAAAAQRQRARVLAAMGRFGEARLVRVRADEAYARLDGVSRDPLTELVLADDESRHHRRRSTPASLTPRQ